MPRLLSAAYVSRWTSIIGALEGVLNSLGTTLAPAEVGALSGHAFRFVLTTTPDGEIGPDGPNLFAGASALPLYESLGWRFTCLEVSGEVPDFAARREEALARIRGAVDRGRPAIVYGLHLPEFGIVRGYVGDDLIASTVVSSQYGERLPAMQWPAPGRGLPLRVFIPKDRIKKTHRAGALTALLRFVVAYASAGDSGCNRLAGPAAAGGFAAYARWIAVLEGPQPISPHGQAYCVQALQAARKDAATFLRARARDITGAAPHLNGAAAAYSAAVIALSQLVTLFPYPNGGNVASAGHRRTGAAIVRRVYALEREAVGNLEAALADL